MSSTKRLVCWCLTAALFGCPPQVTPPDPKPRAELSATALAFGDLRCGAAAVSRSVTLSNSGDAALVFSAAIASGSGFTLSATEGSIEPGGALELSVSAAVPSGATAGSTQSGAVLITTNDPENGSLQVGLTARAAGATLALNPGAANFGVLPVNSSQSLPITLTNSGNTTASVTPSALTDSQFSMSWSGAPAPLAIAPGASATLTTAFRAARIQPASETVTFAVAEGLCGGAVPQLTLSGQGTNGVVGFSATDIYFGTNGKVDCGTQAAPRTFQITNTGNQAFSWNATLRKGAASPFTFAPQSGTVPANGGSVTVTVNTVAIPAVATTATDAFGDVIDVVTDAANAPIFPIALHQTANGAVLSFAPAQLDFGLVPINNSSSAPLSVVNDGSAAVQVTLTSDNARFTLSPPGPTGVQGTAALAVTGTFMPGTSVVQETANVSLSVGANEPLCAPLPAALVLTGTGTSGSVSYSPAALDWGGVNCGTTGPVKTVTFTNPGNQDYTVTPVLARGASSPFALSMSPDSGVAAADGGTVVLTLAPAAIPQTSAVTPNLYGDTLTVSTDVSGDTPHDIPLRLTARGSIFALSTNSLNFGSVVAGATANAQFTATNSGNAPGALNFTAGQPTIFGLPQNSAVAANSSASQNGGFTPPSAGSYSDTATISVTSSTVLCQPLPFTSLALSGVGTSGNVLVLSANSLTFGTAGFTDCGTTAAARDLTVTNNSAASLNLAYALAGGASSPYSVSGPATVAAGAQVTVTVTPKAIPSTASTAPDGFADTLSITASGGSLSELHTVALHQTARGAILSFNPTGLSFNAPAAGSQTLNFTVNNAGNLAAPFTLALGGTNASNFAVSPTSGSAGAGGSASESATYNRPLLGSGPRTASVSVSTSVVRCAPLPASLSLTGN